MMQQPQCPQCAAPLPPAAQKCQFCGFLTPWGATLGTHHHQMAQAAEQRERSARVNKTNSNAKTGLILAIVGLPICCGPLSLVGGILGYRASKQAKANNLPTPTAATIAMVIAVLSCAISVTTITWFYRDQQAKADHLLEVEGRLQGKRGDLDQKVACDLMEEYLLKKGYGGKTLGLGKVNCDGALTVSDRRATLPDVRFAFDAVHSTATACFEKRSRWFVLKIGEGATCSSLPPPEPFTAPPRQLSDEEAAADEAKVRANLATTANTVLISSYLDKLAKVKADAAAAPTAEKLCTKAEMAAYVTGSERKKVAAIDFDLLGASQVGTATSEWAFLSHPSFRVILDEKPAPEYRAREITKLQTESGPLLVVFKTSTAKLWPVIQSKGSTSAKDVDYDGGEFVGTLFVYDVDSAARLCQTSLKFESSDEVSFKKSRLASDKRKISEAVAEDFRDQFENAATKAIKGVAPDLRLGYKVLE